jgi:formate-dependent nitrite reductase membrane component NrfD
MNLWHILIAALLFVLGVTAIGVVAFLVIKHHAERKPKP